MNDKWMPEVGQECWIGPKCDPEPIVWEVIKPTYISDQIVVGVIGGEFELGYSVDAWQFRPITKEADKYRDGQIENMDLLHCDWFGSHAEGKLAAYLYEQGCRILSPDERIVKPLTRQQKYKLFWDESLHENAYELIEAVQRELGVID